MRAAPPHRFALHRRQRGSLLLYALLDNRSAVIGGCTQRAGELFDASTQK
jgi:hypothetical protein